MGVGPFSRPCPACGTRLTYRKEQKPAEEVKDTSFVLVDVHVVTTTHTYSCSNCGLARTLVMQAEESPAFRPEDRVGKRRWPWEAVRSRGKDGGDGEEDAGAHEAYSPHGDGKALATESWTCGCGVVLGEAYVPCNECEQRKQQQQQQQQQQNEDEAEEEPARPVAGTGLSSLFTWTPRCLQRSKTPKKTAEEADDPPLP